MQESIQLVIDSLPFLLKGAGYTLQLSIGGMFFGLLLGFILALMRLSPIWPVRWMARFYISIFRGTPLIAQLFMIYYGLPQFGIELDPIPSAMIGLSLNTAAYAAETLRAAISSIDKGQWEAAASIGMTPWQTMRRAILPQAARVALPPLSNSFISLVKDTSLAATIQVPELFRQAQLITSPHSIVPLFVSTAFISPLSTRRPVTSVNLQNLTPRRLAASWKAKVVRNGSACPSRL